MRKYILTLMVVLLPLMAAAQQQELLGSWKWHFERGEALYRSAKYVEAYEEFRKSEEARGPLSEMERREIGYHLAMSAYRGEKAGAKGMLGQYLIDHPESPYAQQARFAYANVAFSEGNYREALDNYLAVDAERFPAQERDEYNFKTGYSYFELGDYGACYPYMSRIEFKSKYYIHAQYCLGYAEYRRGEYDAAKSYFVNVADSEAYANILPFYLMQIEFTQGNYHYVTENGARVLAMATGERALELTRMIGESWFQIKTWQNAVQYLAEFEERGGAMDREANYMVGFSNYMMDDWAGAEKYLSRVPGPDDKLSQNASYHLGDVYLRLGDKQRALQSFSIASTRGYDDTISEDALFNYGKLQYELGGGYFNEAINVLNRYLSLYPSSRRVPQVKEYLAAAYYNSRNFDAAYQAIRQMPNPDNNVKAAMQKIAYFRALECYQEGDTAEASRMLDESLRYRYNAKYTALAGYWQGEILYREGEYGQAVEKYDTYIKLSPKTEDENLMARYNAGYAYFNMQEWGASRERFDNFLLEYKKNDGFRADAYNRMGDIEYSNRQYWRAIEYYDQAAKLKTPQRYYSAFQRAMMLGMVDRTQRKIESLTDIANAGDSPYTGDAMYELGRTYIATQKYSDAAKTLERFITEYPSAAQYVPALLDLGLVYQNLGDNKRSLTYYKMVVEREKHSPMARDAMNGIRGIYVEENDVDSYFAYARGVGIETDLGTVQRDSLAFVSAQRVYMSGDKNRATEALDNYVKNYPEGAYVGNALYYSGENALALGEKQEAYSYFTKLTQMYNNSFTGKGLERVASLGMELGDYTRSADAYDKLSRAASTAPQRDNALAGLLRATLENGNDGETERVTTDIISRATDKTLLRETKYARAKTIARMGDAAGAMRLYTELSGDVSDAVGAESAWLVIEDAYRSGDTARAEKLIYEFADRNTPHAYWLGKAFLTLGDMYSAAGDTFQARATYQSIVDGYSNTTDGIINEAQERIKGLK